MEIILQELKNDNLHKIHIYIGRFNELKLKFRLIRTDTICTSIGLYDFVFNIDSLELMINLIPDEYFINSIHGFFKEDLEDLKDNIVWVNKIHNIEDIVVTEITNYFNKKYGRNFSNSK